MESGIVYYVTNQCVSVCVCVCARIRACLVAQSCLTLCNPMDCSLPGSSVHGIFQARILEWVAISFSRGSSRPRDRACISFISCIGRQVLYHCTGEVIYMCVCVCVCVCVCMNVCRLPWWLSGKESARNAGDPGSIPRSGRSPGGEYGNPLQHSCLESPMDRGAWWAAVHRVAESDRTEATKQQQRVCRYKCFYVYIYTHTYICVYIVNQCF